MKVLLTADTVGGVWTYALELSDALAERDVEVSLAAMGGALDSARRSELRASRVARAYAEGFALEWMDDPWWDVERAGHWLLRIAREVEPDVVQVNGYAHAALPWGVPVIVVGHSCVLSWHDALRRPPGPGWARYRAVVEKALAAADLLVAPTQAMLDELVRLYEPPCPRRVIPNGRRLRFEHVPKEPFVLTAGRLWDEAKNVQALVRVAPRLDWPVLVAGDGDVDVHLHLHQSPSTSAQRPSGGVRALGHVPREELDRLLARAAIFAEPARYEPFGLAALEAGLAGCALVLGDIPSLREVWGDAALFVEPDDDEQLALVLESLIGDRALREATARRAQRRAAALSRERMADDYLAAYRAVLTATEVQVA